MIKSIKRIFSIASILVAGGLVLWNCEPESDALGSQFFTGAETVDAKYNLIAYNLFNGDSIRSDASKLDSAVIGAFSESQFGMQKADYVTQVRLSTYAPDFGTNPVLDSAVIALKPSYYTATDSLTTTTTEDYTYNDASNTNVAAKKVVTNYRIKKYGKTKIGGSTVMNIKIHRVGDFLGAYTDEVKSNKNVATTDLLGSKEFKGIVSSIKITRDSDASELYTRDATIRIPLDSTFFQNNIIKKGSSTDLGDAASFIRFFRGIKISVDENDGYFFKIAPNDIAVTLYYKKDQTTNSVTTRVQANTTLNLGSANAHFSQIHFDRAGSSSQAGMITDSLNGQDKLYLQGMGGIGAGFKIPANSIADLKNKFKNDKIGIVSAKIRIYTHPNAWDNKYQKPLSFIVRQQGIYTFLTDMSALAGTGKYNLVKTYDLNKTPAFYEIGVTQTLKNIIEKEEKYRDFFINVGTYTYDANGNLMGSYYPTIGNNYNTRAYTPNRAVFVGTILNNADPLYDKGAKLLVTYGQK